METGQDIALDHAFFAQLKSGCKGHRLMSSPLASRRTPATLIYAKFSLPFLAAVAAVQRDIGLRDFTDAALKDPAVLAIAQKVVPVDDSSLD